MSKLSGRNLNRNSSPKYAPERISGLFLRCETNEPIIFEWKHKAAKCAASRISPDSLGKGNDIPSRVSGIDEIHLVIILKILGLSFWPGRNPYNFLIILGLKGLDALVRQVRRTLIMELSFPRKNRRT